ncbi:hypothetical protein B0T20DRAFT_394240 [Sordaria brevicollis]|uniref:Uncharacterized protein n=1 Tax=Sordaria brevicollis TaxID=83679 RepID=A0AAE0PBZ3_SORBR|nr:hypothetical protein B0T20DRAFT_394240 [Sordaria brevicollis]
MRWKGACCLPQRLGEGLWGWSEQSPAGSMRLKKLPELSVALGRRDNPSNGEVWFDSSCMVPSHGWQAVRETPWVQGGRDVVDMYGNGPAAGKSWLENLPEILGSLVSFVGRTALLADTVTASHRYRQAGWEEKWQYGIERMQRGALMYSDEIPSFHQARPTPKRDGEHHQQTTRSRPTEARMRQRRGLDFGVVKRKKGLGNQGNL